MGFGYVTNDPKQPVSFVYTLSGRGYAALGRLAMFYQEEESKIIDRLLIEKAQTLFREKELEKLRDSISGA